MAVVSTSSPPPVVRAWSESDREPVAELLDDEEATRPAHDMHGPALDGGPWRRTLVAELEGVVVAAATAATNSVHPGRFPAVIEVARRARRRRIGSTLLTSLLALRPDPRPLSAKVNPNDRAAAGFVRHHHARRYQHCPGLQPQPSAPEVRRWCRTQISSRPVGTTVDVLGCLTTSERASAWVEQYEWVHEPWSPAARSPLRRLAPAVVAGADADLSVVTVRDDRVSSVAWAFNEGAGAFSIVCECVHRDEPDGEATVALALAHCLRRLSERGVDQVDIDGHDTDAHLAPVLRSFPPGAANPLDLVELA